MRARIVITLSFAATLALNASAGPATPFFRGITEVMGVLEDVHSILRRLGQPIEGSATRDSLLEGIRDLRVDGEDVEIKNRVLALLEGGDDGYLFSREHWDDRGSDIARLVHRYADTPGNDPLFPYVMRFEGGEEAVSLRSIWSPDIAELAQRSVPWQKRDELATILQTELPKRGFLKPSPQELADMSTESLGLATLMIRMSESSGSIRDFANVSLTGMRDTSIGFFHSDNRFVQQAFMDSIVFSPSSSDDRLLPRAHINALREIHHQFSHQPPALVLSFTVEEYLARFASLYDHQPTANREAVSALRKAMALGIIRTTATHDAHFHRLRFITSAEMERITGENNDIWTAIRQRFGSPF